ncbi:hypothetical protein Pvag_pPag30088 (plasmid) [Pantoea vagans C9-1]|nr:hypothetical protein Pvag_pPag30088 [Pantoea vagans C9-1]
MTEELLGIKRHGDTLIIHAQLPDDWPSFSMTYQHRQSQYCITISRGESEYQVTLDGIQLPDDKIHLVDDAHNHRVDIIQR